MYIHAFVNALPRARAFHTCESRALDLLLLLLRPSGSVRCPQKTYAPQAMTMTRMAATGTNMRFTRSADDFCNDGRLVDDASFCSWAVLAARRCALARFSLCST